MILIAILIFFLLTISFFFNLAEMTYLNLDRAEYAAIQQTDREKGQLITKIISSPPRLFTTVLIGIHASLTTANVLVSHLLISLPLSQHHREIILIGYGAIVILFAEAFPQVLGVRYASSLSRALPGAVLFFLWFMSPFTQFVEFLFRHLHREKPRPYLERASWASEDLLRLASSAPRAISSSIARFITARNYPISGIMRPAAQVVSLIETDSLQSVIRKFSASRFSRLPYWKSGPARFFAYLHVKDALRLFSEGKQDWKPNLHPLPVFLTTTSVLKAFLHMRSYHAHIAAVTTPDGKIAGIITMDDLLQFFIPDFRTPDSEPRPENLPAQSPA